jgi:hypothetical protein
MFLYFMLESRATKIGAPRDRLEKRGDQTSLITGLMRTGLDACKMILAQPLYPERDGRKKAGCPRQVFLANPPSLFLQARILRPLPPRDARVQVSNKRGQSDQQEWSIIVHEVFCLTSVPPHAGLAWFEMQGGRVLVHKLNYSDFG